MAIETALETPVHLQWDPDSRLPSPDPGSAPNNCGPTSVANIAHFYRENHPGVYYTRTLAVSDPTRATSVNEQKVMLEKRGVPCYIGQPILSQIRDYVARGRRPLVLGLFMEKVPYLVAGHNFRGWHAVEVLGLHGSDGVLVRDPNFNRTYRTDPTDGKRPYPNWVITAAFTNVGGWGLIPLEPKPDPKWDGRVVAETGARIRYHPIEDDASTLFAIAERDGYTHRPGGAKLWRTATYAYYWNGEIYESSGIRWYRLRTHNGNVRFIRVGAASVKRPA